MKVKSRLSFFKDDLRPILREAKFTFRKVKKNPFSLFGIIIIAIFIGIALLAPVIAPPKPGADPYILEIREDWHSPFLTPPPTPSSPDHPFGTVAGYDIYYGCIWGTRTAFHTSLLVTLIALTIGIFIGCVAGYFGGFIDELLMRFTDIFLAFPSLLLAMLLIVIMPPEWPMNLGPISFTVALNPLDKVIVVLAVTAWPTYARLIRGEVVKVKNEGYVEAAKAIGCSNFRIVFRHILPNSIYPVMAIAFLNMGGVILAAATLTFLNVRTRMPGSIGPPTAYAEWGLLITLSRDWIITGDSLKYTYTFITPCVFLITFALGWTLLSDTLRDMLDPTIRRR